MSIQKHDIETKKLYLQRTFNISAGFIAEYLKPGVSVIDCGCGPGNITVEIAKRVSPGIVIGIDADNSSLDIARKLAKKQGVDNLSFKQGNVYELPFENDAFDIAYSHAVLSNLEDPVKALIEYKRVIKTNGLVAVRESDYSSTMSYPENKTFTEIFTLLHKFGSLYGDLFIGKKLRKLFSDAHLKNTIATASCESYGNDKALKEFTQYIAHQLTEDQVYQSIIKLGWATEKQLNEYVEQIKSFSDFETTFFAYNWVECIGFKN